MATVRLILPPSPRYDQVRDAIVTGFLLGGGLRGYSEEDDYILVEAEEARRRLPLLPLKRGLEELHPVLEKGGGVAYGRGDRRVYEALRLDSRLRGYRDPLIPSTGLLVLLDWRQLLYYRIPELERTAKSLHMVLGDAPTPSLDDARLAGHAYALLAAVKLRGLDKDIRVVHPTVGWDSGVIPSSTYKLLSYVDEECLVELEEIAVDALENRDPDALSYLAQAVENRDSYALKHMLRRMGCRVEADRLIAPADVIG